MEEVGYAKTWQEYFRRGYKPFPVIGKGNEGGMPTGITGNAPPISADQYPRWASSPRWADANMAIRAEGLAGLDIDQYDGKQGWDHLQKLIEKFGPLPETVRSTSRGFENPSGIRLYRLPDASVHLKGKPAGRDADIEMIQMRHRFGVVSPSIHPKHGGLYRWYAPDGEELEYPWPVEDLPYLPDSWIEGLRVERGPEDPDAVIRNNEELFSQFPEGSPCEPVERWAKAIRETDAASHIGHDAFYSFVVQGVMLGREGHSGVLPILTDLRDRFEGYLRDLGDQTRGSGEVQKTGNDAVMAAQRKLVDPNSRHERTCQALETFEREVEDVLAASPSLAPSAPAAGDVAPRFFNSAKETGHRTADIAAAVAGDLDLILAPGGQWLRHEGGRWLADAETLLHKRCAYLLNSRYRANIWQDVKALLQTLHSHPVNDDSIDTFYINTPGGLLDYKTGTVVPHSPGVYNFNQISVSWDANATAPEFDKWAREVFRDEDNYQMAMEVMGYCLLNDLPIQKAIVLIHGPGAPSGRNGKGSYLRILEAILGTHNITAVPPQMFGEDRWAAASLYGKLANLAGDVAATPFKDAAMFKSLTGQDIIRADVKYREPILFRNRATILASFNELPTSADRSTGFLERWVALPFFGNFSGNKADPTVVDRIIENELPGILRIAVESLNHLLQRGHFALSEASRAAMTDFKTNVDSVRRFLAELHDEPEETAGLAGLQPPWSCSDLYSSYKGWCDDQGYRPLGRNKFISGVEAATDSPFGPLVKVRRKQGMMLVPVDNSDEA